MLPLVLMRSAGFPGPVAARYYRLSPHEPLLSLHEHDQAISVPSCRFLAPPRGPIKRSQSQRSQGRVLANVCLASGPTRGILFRPAGLARNYSFIGSSFISVASKLGIQSGLGKLNAEPRPSIMSFALN